ncbi:LacI family DNA-binding transcriptional regulator [Alteromonas lipolytica]|uniref:LacI family transcriptional regulator n=1 Tax=Alteromonas lipolytica TaxID=1856405 RepID=A0A1E8FB70_9ALTE|nr:LacI family DNA-binding transcriptional regulator [Alteromonas lipolytica]OFI33155.1 LacI family transcriptional regulator [Alteromonas lipolytica]GGF62022.1 transcriptional regulator [Alteromonas lipolytica]
MVTIKQVSEKAGVSSATVSRVINNPDTVKEKTRELVMAAMAELGYRHNVVAASLASNKTHTIGYVVPELHGSFFGAMMGGTEQALRQAKKHMLIATGHSDAEIEKEQIDALLSRRCDALILHVEAVSDDYLVNLVKQGVQLVVVNRFIEAIGEHCISLDNIKGGYLATRHLLEIGHTKIAYVAGSLFKDDGKNRLLGHQQALAEWGIGYDENLTFEGNFQARSGTEGIRTLVEQGASFTAVACANDEMASGAMIALRELGRRVPEDVSVIGFDNVDFASYLSPGLTTIDYPVQKIGRMAAHWVLEQVYGHVRHDFEHILAPRLILRGTTSSPH